MLMVPAVAAVVIIKIVISIKIKFIALRDSTALTYAQGTIIRALVDLNVDKNK